MTATSQAIVRSPDPMPAGKLGMSLFLASEAMFFVGVLGSFLVLQSGQRALFHHMASVLSTWETIVLMALLIAASAVIAIKPRRLSHQWMAIALATGFAVFQILICGHLLAHHTVVQRTNGQLMIYDGAMSGPANSRVIDGISTPLTAGFDATGMTPADFKMLATASGRFSIHPDDVLQDVPEGPWRNNFFASYFLIVGAHLVHLLVGIAAMLWLSLRISRKTVTTVNIGCVHSYWHFVNVVGVLALLLLFFA